MERSFVNAVLEEVVDRLGNYSTSVQEIKKLVDDVYAGKWAFISPQQRGNIAYLIEEISIDLVDQFRKLGVYWPDGRMPYAILPVNDPLFSDLLLIKKHELPNCLHPKTASR